MFKTHGYKIWSISANKIFYKFNCTAATETAEKK